MTGLLFAGLFSATTMLFVGNSYTMGNGGLWSLADSLFGSVTGDTLITLSHTMGGATFQDHWNHQELRWLLENGEIDIAIFQEQSCMPVVNPRLTWQYGDSLALLCAAGGIQPSFLMTWPRRNDFLMLHGLEAAIPGWDTFTTARLLHAERPSGCFRGPSRCWISTKPTARTLPWKGPTLRHR